MESQIAKRVIEGDVVEPAKGIVKPFSPLEIRGVKFWWNARDAQEVIDGEGTVVESVMPHGDRIEFHQTETGQVSGTLA